MSFSAIGISELLDEFRPGRIIYIPGASGELKFMQDILTADPERLSGVNLVSCFLPGMNTFDYAALNPECRVSTFLLPPAMRASFEAGRVHVLPLSYSAIADFLASLNIDVAILHLTAPENGICTFGVAADFGPIVAGAAGYRVGIVNRAAPRPIHSPTIPLSELDGFVEIDEPPMSAPDRKPTLQLEAIAQHVASLVPDGATIQTGIGQAPMAIWRALKGHRDLRLWSGVVTDGFFDAHDAGALAPSGHLAGIAFCTEQSYKRFDRSDLVHLADVRRTHGTALGEAPRVVSVNSALEIDLLGQVNLEWQDGRLIGGVGGAPDFNAAALRSPGGRSVIALPATARHGAVSRISVRLGAPTASLSRTEIDTVVTEHGIAALRGLTMEQRAQALISIAEPVHRETLEIGWASMRRHF